MIEHSSVPTGEIHAVHNWVVADEAALSGLSVTSGDVRKYAFQTEGSIEWMLVSHSPKQWVRKPTQAELAPIVDAFTVVPGKNLYDKSNASDGKIRNYDGGGLATYANGIDLGYFPVEAGKTYTVSMGDSLGFSSNKAIYCEDAAGAYLGIAEAIGATPAMAAPPINIVWLGLSQVTFTIGPGSAIRSVSVGVNYSVHDTTRFNAVIDTVQAEEGAVKTAYEAHDPDGTIELKNFDERVSEIVDASIFDIGSTRAIRVSKVGNDLYLRTSFSDTADLIQKIALSGGPNGVADFYGAKSTPKGYEVIAAWGAGSFLQTSADDAAPLQYNGTYIGGNHGAFIVKEVTATAHGKTTPDVGSEWTDSGANKWYLMKVVDANKLWFLSENKSVYPAWSFLSAFTGTTLTHSSGATNTGAITIGSSVTTQLTPSLQNQTTKIYLDGVTEVTADGDYYCDTLDVVNKYNVTNPASVVDYVRSQVGSATQPPLNHASIEHDVARTLTYKFAENGTCSVIDGTHNINQITLGYYGAIQAYAAVYTGGELWQYIPRTLPKVGGVKTWDMKAMENIGGTFEQLVFNTVDWEDANNPPDRMAQIVKVGGTRQHGLMIGYSPVRSVGLPALRKTLTTTAGFVSAARKQYLEAVSGVVLPANSYYEIAGYRAYWNAALVPSATTFVWVRDGKSILVFADFHQNVTLEKLPLPQKFTGMDAAVVDKTASATLHGNGVVAAGGLLVSVTGGYGYLVIKLT